MVGGPHASAARRLTLDWVEKNGPPARRPRRLGFGSRLIGLVIERQMNGEVHRSFSRSGLSVRMIVPLTHERWPSQPAAKTRNRLADIAVVVVHCLGMHVFREPVGRQIVAGAVLFRLAIE